MTGQPFVDNESNWGPYPKTPGFVGPYPESANFRGPYPIANGFTGPFFTEYAFSDALRDLAIYSPRLAANFQNPAGSLYTDASRTTQVTAVGNRIRSFTNFVTGQPHGSASSDAKSPLFARYPATGRRNLFSYTEAFDNGYWTKGSATIASDVAANPVNGELTADRMTTSASFGEVRASAYQVTGNHTLTCYVKNESLVDILLRLDRSGNTANMVFTFATEAVVTSGANVISGSATNLGNGWYRLRVTGNVTSTAWISGITGGSTAGAALIWGSQLEQSATATNYQRVVTSADITEAGVRDVYAALFDGADNCLQVSGFDLSNTDKVCVIAGVRKLSDAGRGVLLEHSASVANDGTFNIEAPTSAAPNYTFMAKGTDPLGGYVPTGFAAPITNWISCVYDLGSAGLTTQVIPRINNTINQTAGFNTASGGNFINSTLNIGGRNNSASLPFNGAISYLFILGLIPPDAVLTKVYRGLAPQIGVSV